MTKEEAIKLIEHIGIAFVPTDQYGDYDDPQPYDEALGMAIEALQDLSKPNNTCEVDLISRQDAIRWVKTECNPYGKPTLDFESGKKVIEHLGQMPSADRPTEWIPVTKDGKNFPPYSEFILVWVNYGFEIASYEYDPETGADFWHMDFYDLYGENIWEVKAWCPLPEPYREDGEA